MKIATKLIVDTAIKFDWADESSTSFDLSLYKPDMITSLALHGLKQKLGDTYSGAEKNGWSIAECKAKVQEVSDAMAAGDWNLKGGGFATGGITVEAMAVVAGCTIDEAREAWNGYDEEKRKAQAKHPAIVAAALKIKAERAKAKAKDADSETFEM